MKNWIYRPIKGSAKLLKEMDELIKAGGIVEATKLLGKKKEKKR